MKICTKCGIIKPLDQFYKNKRRASGRTSACAKCSRKQALDRYYANRDKLVKTMRVWREANRDKLRACYQRYEDDNREARRARGRAYAAANRDKANKRKKEYYRNDPTYRLTARISSGIKKSITSKKNGRSWESIVGYTIDDLRRHIERQFQKGMSWDNMGEWHIDHIVPVSSFDFASHEDPEFKAAWALLNLRPMWASENMSKGATRELLL